MPDTPNIVFVHTDQQHHKAIGAYGNPYVKTPHLDRIATEGYNFMESVSACPVCCPARTGWYTGRASKETGVPTNAYPLQQHIPDLGQWLTGKTDYEAVYSGKWHVPQRDVRRSFNVLHPGHGQGEIGDSDATRAALAWLLNRKTDRPFFLSLGLLNPHDCCFPGWPEGGPYKFSFGKEIERLLPPLPDNFDKTIAQNRGSKTRTWSELDWRYYIYNYYRMTEMVDCEIGRMHNALRHSRYTENTVFIFSSDHGDGIGHHGHIGKGPLDEEFCRVPLIISWPGHTKAGARDTEHLVTGLDIPGTICDLAGAPKLPDTTQSRSLRPLLAGKTGASWRDYSVIESSQGPLTVAIRDKRYKSIIGPASTRLFDISKDPLETRDLAEQTEYAHVLNTHRRHLREYVTRIDTFRPPANMKALLEADRKRPATRRHYPRGDLYTPYTRWYDAVEKEVIQ
jgi:choline-sulfatase